MAFHDLAEGTLTENIENEVSISRSEGEMIVSSGVGYPGEIGGILVTRFLASKDIVNVKDIITILIVIPVILDSFAGFGQYSSRISRRLIVEARVAYPVRGREVGCQRLKRLSQLVKARVRFAGHSR